MARVLRSHRRGQWFEPTQTHQFNYILMNIVKLIASNTFYQVINRAATALSTLIGTVLLTRTLGAEFFGEYSIVFAYITIYYLIADFGVNAVVVRDFAKDQTLAKANFSKILGMRVVFGLIIAFTAFVILSFFPYSELVKSAIFIGIPIIFLNSISRAAAILFQSNLRYDQSAISAFIGSLFFLILLWIFIQVPNPSLSFIVIPMLFGAFITTVISLYFVRDYIRVDTNWFDLPYWKKVMIDAFPLGIALTLNVLMIHTDKLILSVMSVPVSIGVYALAYRIFDFVLVFPSFFMNSMFPILSKSREEDMNKYRKYLANSIWTLFFISIIMIIPALLFSKPIILSIWGEDIAAAYMPFNILVLGIVAFFITVPLSWAALLEGKQIMMMKLYGLAFLFNLFANILVVPIFDYNGAAFITILTEFIILVVLLYKMRETIVLKIRDISF